MKRFISIVLVVFTLFLIALPAFAAESNDGESEISPRFTYIIEINTGLTIDQDTGTAYCSAYCSAVGNNRVTIVYKLERYDGTSWSSPATWTASGTGSAGLQKSTTVNSSYLYRARVTYSVYSATNALLETTSRYEFP